MRDKEVIMIKYLLRKKETDVNISKIAKDVRMDYKNTHSIIKRLEKKEVVALQTFGKSCKVVLNNRCHPLIFQAEYEQREEILKNKNLKVLMNYYERHMKSMFYVMLLFGSYAKETRTKRSDIDLLFIVPDEGEEVYERNIQNITSMIPLKIHVNIFKEKDFLAMKNSKEQTVGSETIKRNIILHGIELYYELIQ